MDEHDALIEDLRDRLQSNEFYRGDPRHARGFRDELGRPKLSVTTEKQR